MNHEIFHKLKLFERMYPAQLDIITEEELKHMKLKENQVSNFVPNVPIDFIKNK